MSLSGPTSNNPVPKRYLTVGNRRWATALACVWLAGCSLPPDMSKSAAVGTHEHPLNPPAGTLAIDGPPILSRATAWNTLTNPRPASTNVLDEGAEMYRIYCAVCHGSDAAGQGPVAEYFRRMPDLGAPYIQGYPDGRLYTIIREGGFNMPSYANSLSVEERWAVVHYLRTFGNTR